MALATINCHHEACHGKFYELVLKYKNLFNAEKNYVHDRDFALRVLSDHKTCFLLHYITLDDFCIFTTITGSSLSTMPNLNQRNL